MWHKNTPLENLIQTFKAATVHFAAVYAIVMGLFSLFLMGANPGLGILCLVNAGFAYWCGYSIRFSLKQEERARRIAVSDDET